jgi:dihydropteroate synthase
VTPDSFSDGGDFFTPASAIDHALGLVAEGADLIDIGGESTRPHHQTVSAADEQGRICPVIAAVAARTKVPISVDTMKAKVASAALEAGAMMVNDVWGLQHDPDMAHVVASHRVPVIIMHNRHAEDPSIDIVRDVVDFLSRSIDLALAAGVAHSQIIVDPGFGFAKTHAQSLRLVRELDALNILGCPILLGVSRKRAIGFATEVREPKARLIGSLATAVLGVRAGAKIVRVHDVAPHVEAMRMCAAVLSDGGGEP